MFKRRQKDPSKKLVRQAPKEAKRLLSETNLKELAQLFTQLAVGGTVLRSKFTSTFFPEFKNLSNAFFDSFDTNRDGKLDWDEFVIGLTLCNSRSSKEEKLNIIFRMFDRDADQKVTKEEMRRLLTTSFFRASHIKKAFNELDGHPSERTFVNLPDSSELDERVEHMLNNAFYHYALSSNDSMTFAEFTEWALESWDIEQLLRRLVDPAPAQERIATSIDSIKSLVRSHPEVAQFFRAHNISPSVLIADMQMLQLVTSLLGSDINKQSEQLEPAPQGLSQVDILAAWHPAAICLAEAIYPYTSQTTSDMTIKPGDRMFITSQSPNGWWLASLKGKMAYVPANYVRPLLYKAGSPALADPCSSPARQLPAAPASAPEGATAFVPSPLSASSSEPTVPLDYHPTASTPISAPTSRSTSAIFLPGTRRALPPPPPPVKPLVRNFLVEPVPQPSDDKFPLPSARPIFQPLSDFDSTRLPPPIAPTSDVPTAIPDPPPAAASASAPQSPPPPLAATAPSLRAPFVLKPIRALVPPAPTSAPADMGRGSDVVGVLRSHPKLASMFAANHDTPNRDDPSDEWD